MVFSSNQEDDLIFLSVNAQDDFLNMYANIWSNKNQMGHFTDLLKHEIVISIVIYNRIWCFTKIAYTVH
jgi:hypothetical protein